MPAAASRTWVLTGSALPMAAVSPKEGSPSRRAGRRRDLLVARLPADDALDPAGVALDGLGDGGGRHGRNTQPVREAGAAGVTRPSAGVHEHHVVAALADLGEQRPGVPGTAGAHQRHGAAVRGGVRTATRWGQGTRRSRSRLFTTRRCRDIAVRESGRPPLSPFITNRYCTFT